MTVSKIMVALFALKIISSASYDNSVEQTVLAHSLDKESCVRAQDRLFDDLYVKWNMIKQFGDPNLSITPVIEEYTIVLKNNELGRTVVQKIVCEEEKSL
jgi:hypothetical protein